MRLLAAKRGNGVRPWLVIVLASLPAWAKHGGGTVTLAVEASGRVPGFKGDELPRYLSAQMAAEHAAGWRFEPAPSGAVSPDRVEWEFRLHLRAAQGVSHLERERRLPGMRRLVTIKATLFLNGECRGVVRGEAGVRGGPHDRDLADAVSRITRSILAGRFRPDTSFWERDVASGDWEGLRARLEDRGVSIGIEWVAEGFSDFRGGIRKGAVAASTADVDASLDLETLLGVRGGEFYVDLEDHAGRDPSTALVGDAQVFDKLNSRPYFEVFELWYEQRLLHDTLRIKAGKVDANTEFSVVDNGLSFVNSSAQVSPTLFVLPTTPAPMPGINFRYTPKGPFYASFAVYDSNRSDHFLDFYGDPESAQPTRDGMFLIGETGLNWVRFPGLKSEGNLRVGFWGHTGTFTRFDGGTQRGAEGHYVIFDQTLWRPLPEQDEQPGLRTFLEYGQTDRAVAPVYRHLGGGLTWTGLLPGRRKDVAGFGPQYARLSPRAGLSSDYELAVETFYRAQVTPWSTVQADLQYIAHPGGRYPSALVGTLRLKMIF
jgi:porin